MECILPLTLGVSTGEQSDFPNITMQQKITGISNIYWRAKNVWKNICSGQDKPIFLYYRTLSSIFIILTPITLLSCYPGPDTQMTGPIHTSHTHTHHMFTWQVRLVHEYHQQTELSSAFCNWFMWSLCTFFLQLLCVPWVERIKEGRRTHKSWI